LKRALAIAFLVGCAAEGQPEEPTSILEQDTTVCGVGPTVKGIDVSYYQGTINWSAVKGDGVEYAFIRVSDGTGFVDPKFETYWSGSRAVGIRHGAYQFFRPGQDPVAQADLLLSKIGGTLAADDLPPVVDVEASDGLSATQIQAKLKIWVDRVKAAIGRDPIVYTGFYFWRDSVGAPDYTASPLWHAQYTTAACPNIAPPWQGWAFWQFTSSGTVAGISGNVDVDRWNGDRASLEAFLGPATPVLPCSTIGYAGAVIDDGDSCFEPGGPATSMRRVADAGQDGDLIWTHTTEDAAEANFGLWHFDFEQAGRYKLEVYTDGAYAQSKQAKYIVGHGAASDDVVVDQTAVDGWQTVGEFDFEAGPDQWLRLGDNTGEPLASNVQLVFDAVRLTRIETDTGSGSGSGDGGGEMPGDAGGCSAGGGQLGLALGALVAGLRRRRTK
jgi:GH25 family lysozyme M1 (1,4-beta-N-acetylmuramidase)